MLNFFKMILLSTSSSLNQDKSNYKELSPELKSLYRHWFDHTNYIQTKSHNDYLSPEVYKNFNQFATERMNMYYRKIAGIWPVSEDKILKNYKFCNIYRELDRDTISFHSLLLHLRDDFGLWLLNMAFCRYIARYETIRTIGLLSFDANNNKKVFDRLIAMQSPKYGSAYVFPISIIQNSPYNTREKFFCMYLPQVMKDCANSLNTLKKESVSTALQVILDVFNFNFRFHWTEILIDVAYQYPHLINLFDQFPIGPGSSPTMKALSSKNNPELSACN